MSDLGAVHVSTDGPNCCGGAAVAGGVGFVTDWIAVAGVGEGNTTVLGTVAIAVVGGFFGATVVFGLIYRGDGRARDGRLGRRRHRHQDGVRAAPTRHERDPAGQEQECGRDRRGDHEAPASPRSAGRIAGTRRNDLDVVAVRDLGGKDRVVSTPPVAFLHGRHRASHRPCPIMVAHPGREELRPGEDFVLSRPRGGVPTVVRWAPA